MKNATKSERWLPFCSWSAENDLLLDQEYFDFDEQSARLASHGQEYLQLTEGKFYGRFVSCSLGNDTSIHIEHANQALSQSIAGAPNVYAIGVVLSENTVFRANGVDIDYGSFFIIPPGVDFHLYSPQNATILAVVIDQTKFEETLQIAPHICEWLRTQTDNISYFYDPNITERLRRDVYTSMLSCRSGLTDDKDASMLGDALVTSFAASLMLSWHMSPSHFSLQSSKTFNRFINIKHRLSDLEDVSSPLTDLSTELSLSKRSIQYALSTEVSLGVAGYLRHTRLHAVRRSLRQNNNTDVTIGDIASQHGFWNWSHFSQQYRQLFGEAPSATRPTAQ